MTMVTLTRPRRANAMTAEMIATMTSVIESVSEGPSEAPGNARAVVLRAEGKVFSGGIDLKDAREGQANDGDAPSVQQRLTRLISAIEQCPAPVVALVEGACVGGAVEMVLACDVRLATPQASFKVPATTIGTVYRPEGFDNLSRRLTAQALRQLVLLGARFDVDQARWAGLVDDVVEGPDALDRVALVTDTIAASPATFTAQKRALAIVSAAAALPEDVMAALADIRSKHAHRLTASVVGSEGGRA